LKRPHVCCADGADDCDLHNQDCGPLGDIEMREFLAGSWPSYRGMSTTPDDILVTLGSGQGLELINEILCEPGDLVIMEKFTYQGAMNRLRARYQHIRCETRRRWSRY
jgi:DNA-binding transcriptional MocR family regulator